VFENESHDVHLLDDPFWIHVGGVDGGGQYMPDDSTFRYFLGGVIDLGIEPCAGLAAHNYCEGPLWWGIGLSRWFIMYESYSAWRMQCNEFDWGAASQLEPRPVAVNIGDPYYRIARVHAVAEYEKPYAFGPTKDFYCFSKREDDQWENAASSSEQVDALDSLDVVLNCRYSDDDTAYPHRSPWEVELKNAAWRMVNLIVDRLDDAHDPTQSYDADGLNRWRHFENFDENNLTLEQLGLEPYPAVRGVPAGDEDWPGGLYTAYAGEPIPLVCRSWLTGIDIPATLTLYTCTVVLHLSVEERGIVDEPRAYRLQATAFVAVHLRVKLGAIPEDYPYTMVNPDDPFNLTVDQAGEFLTAMGPNGERVPLLMRWHGLNSHRRYSRSPNTFAELSDTQSGSVCCGTLHTINNGYIHAELNDCSEYDPSEGADPVEKPQWQRGGISLGVDWIDPGGGCSA
jgi:hypothetical protein